MLTFFEKILFEKFKDMPKGVRVVTYLVMLSLFAYLVLLPKFIEAQILTCRADGRVVPYRGTSVYMHIDGRDYTFMTNERGFVSIPLITKIPSSIEVSVHNVDLDKDIDLIFELSEIWRLNKVHKVEMSGDSVKFVSKNKDENKDDVITKCLNMIFPRESHAGILIAPGKYSNNDKNESLKNNVRETILTLIKNNVNNPEAVTGVDFQLKGDRAPNYVEKISIVQSIEEKYNLQIPDAHWQSFLTVGELIDYVTKRLLLADEPASNSRMPQSSQKSWKELQESFPINERPVFKY